jgi:hypothetical protein
MQISAVLINTLGFVLITVKNARIIWILGSSKPSPYLRSYHVLYGTFIPLRVKIKTKLHGMSPRANYTDRATAACWRSDCQLFADRECHVVSVTDPYGRILGFLDRNRYFSIK